jgi:hypothetical protein
MRTWLERDLPVLRYLRDNPAEGGLLGANWMERGPHPDLQGLTQADFYRAVVTLGDAHYVTWHGRHAETMGGVYWTGFRLTGEGMQALGDWPVFEALGQPPKLGAVLERLAGMAPSDEEEGNLHAAATRVRGIAPDLLRAVVVGAAQTLARHVV